jgi:catechol 2,3-dioxygenase-like lactoylglutathione lyase family enzyme
MMRDDFSERKRGVGKMSLSKYFENFVVFYFRVSDLDRALAFYQRLGFHPVYENKEIGWTELSFGNHRRPYLGLNLYRKKGKVPINAGGIPSFEVQDLEQLKAELIRMEIPHEGVVKYSQYFHFLWILDPDGNRIELPSEGSKPFCRIFIRRSA